MATSSLFRRSRNLLVPAALAVTLVASGCGSDSGSEPPDDPSPSSVVTDGDTTLPDGPLPVEPDGGIGDGAGPPPGLDGQPIPVEPDGGIGDGAGPPIAVGADALVGVTWTLTIAEVDGATVVLDPVNPVTLVVEHEDISADPTKMVLSGRAACNGYFGQAFFDGGAIFEPAGIGQTEMGCEPAIMVIEIAYTTALAQTNAIEFGDGTITLTGPTSSLTYTA